MEGVCYKTYEVGSERERLQTLARSPLTPSSSISLIFIARRGFYFNFFLQKVCCYKCALTVPVENLREIIEKHSPEACYRFSKSWFSPSPPTPHPPPTTPPPPTPPPTPCPTPPPTPPPPQVNRRRWRTRRLKRWTPPPPPELSPEEIRSRGLLEKEIEELLDDDKCKICLSDTMSIVLQPCGHFLLCFQCSLKFTNCPVCRGKIHKIISVNHH